MKKLIETDSHFRNLEPETYDVIATYVKSPELLGIKKKCMTGGKVNMCKAINEMILEGVIKTARKYGATEQQIVENLMIEHNLDEATARKYCEEFK